jgi:hypothetical protein
MHRFRSGFCRLLLSISLASVYGLMVGTGLSSARAEIKLIGTARLDGNSVDRSDLKDTLAGDIPPNRLGGISAIEFTGHGHEYVVLADRGPADGASAYRCRFHILKLEVEAGQSPSITATLQATTLLQDESGRNLVGSDSAFEKDPAKSLRFDPEGVRIDRQGKIFMSDEYGPSVYRFSESGKRTAILKVPPRFKIARLSAKATEEASQNTVGRQPNGGLEGLAIIPDGTKLYASMQRPLIQDSRAGKEEGDKRLGTNTRIIEFDVAGGTTREFLYPLDDTRNGVSEILAINSHEFLVLERDSKGGPEAVAKKIFKVDLAGATDISQHETLPAEGIPAGVTPARKSLFLDMLSPKFGLAGSSFPEKIEGLAFGPDLADGRRLLVVAVDNDFIAEKPILLHAFAIDRDDLPGFGW